MTTGFNPVPIGMRLGQKRKGQLVNQTVVNIVKKELQKRNESPRSRRQMVNNLAGPQSYNRKGVLNDGNQVSSNQFLAGNPNMMNQTFTNGMDMSGMTATTDASFAAGRKDGANRGVIAGKFQGNDGINSF
jgi:hypothetical protein